MLRRALLVVVLAASGCAADDAPAQPVARVEQAILRGTASDDGQDATVMLFQLDPVANRRVGLCTAALIAPRLLLTARHCVAAVNPGLLACDADGTPVVGGEITGRVDASRLFVFTGRKRPEHIGAEAPDLDTAKWAPRAQGLEVIDDGSSTLCNHDLALVLLKEPIEDVPLATLRLDGDARAGEKLLTVGWGVASGEIEPSIRQQRRDVTVTRVGPNATIPTLTPSEFLFDESICLGDSGGPIFAQATNAIVGVVSRGGNGEDPSGAPAVTCVDATNIGTKLAPFKALLLDAFRRAGAEPLLEPQEDDGCTAAPVGARRGALPLVTALLLGAAALRRRRRRFFRPLAPRDNTQRS